MKKIFNLLIGCSILLMTVIGCSRSATVYGNNADADGWDMYITIDGKTQHVPGYSYRRYEVTWTGFESSYWCTMSATYVNHGGYTSGEYKVEDGEEYTWTVYYCPGYFSAGEPIILDKKYEKENEFMKK
ncbi:MAG: hypothetical protein JSV25_09510 [Spirochaetota bacterium]|nr:MAG: hypothetical protein JSV25_09510 [Spirochaetota bacterium]